MLSVKSAGLRSLCIFFGLVLFSVWGCNNLGSGGGNMGGAIAAAGGEAGKDATGGSTTAGGTVGTTITGGGGSAVVTGGQGGMLVSGGAGGSSPTGGTGGTIATGGAGGMAVDPDACPVDPQGKKCDVASCNYSIDGKTGRCMCNIDFFLCSKLPAPAGSADCPANANQMRCGKIGSFCKVNDLKFCVCQQIGSSNLWSCP